MSSRSLGSLASWCLLAGGPALAASAGVRAARAASERSVAAVAARLPLLRPGMSPDAAQRTLRLGNAKAAEGSGPVADYRRLYPLGSANLLLVFDETRKPASLKRASLVATALSGGGDVSPAAFRKRIAPAAPARFAAVRDASDWQNPFLIVGPGGVEIRAPRAFTTPVTVPAEGAAGELATLHPTAWPYGRVTAVQEASILSGNADDRQRMRRAREIVEPALRDLGVRVEAWPSG